MPHQLASPSLSLGEPPPAVLDLMRQGVSQGVFPGGQLAVSAKTHRYRLAVGLTALTQYPSSRPVTDATLYDVASLTKVLCTSLLLMQAVDRWGEPLLEQRLDRYFPEVPYASSICLRDLAAHRAGLVAHRPFFETIWAEQSAIGFNPKQRMRQLICAQPLAATPATATIYSDLGYLLLGWILEDLFGCPLDELFLERVAQPLGLTATRYGPVTGVVAATEADEQGQLLVGRVHDENCRSLGGVAGHAGLFSRGEEVERILDHLVEIRHGNPGLVSPAVLQEFWKPIPNSSYTLGWDTPTEPSSSGRYTTRGSCVGHLGFTGCSLWVDYHQEVTVVLLTNRVHPTRENLAIRAFRPRLHDLVFETLLAV
ncbi:MAG: beta-lactamase family protein [Bradymonadales bacterium]|nr:beta-lactamase family protein [Bradymonadales bacterium]